MSSLLHSENEKMMEFGGMYLGGTDDNTQTWIKVII